MSTVSGWDWVAADFIWFPGPVLAFTPGQLVPNSTVDANGWALTGVVVPWPGSPDPAAVNPMLEVSVGEVA